MKTAETLDQRKTRTFALALDVQALMMDRQKVLLQIPEVAYQVVMDLNGACASSQNGFVNLVSSVKIESTWVPMSQLSHSDVVEAVGDVIASLGDLYVRQVQGNAISASQPGLANIAKNGVSRSLDGVLLNDQYLKDYFDAPCEMASLLDDASDSALYDRFNLSRADAKCLVQDFESLTASLKQKIEDMMRLNEPAFRDILRPYVNGSFNTDDLFAEAYDGFFRACVKYIPDTQTNFYSHLKRWVTARVVRFMDRDSCIVSIGSNSGTLYRKIRNARKRLASEGKVVSITSVAEAVGTSVKEVVDSDVSFSNWGDIDDLYGGAVDSYGLTPEKSALEHDTKAFVADLLGKLTAREAHIIAARYGIGCRPQTLEELGETFGITLEGIRLAQKKAERKLAVLAQGAI